jgi:hypothetical protein
VNRGPKPPTGTLTGAHYFLVTIESPSGNESRRLVVFVADRPVYENAVLAAGVAVSESMQAEGYKISELLRIDVLESIRIRKARPLIWEIDP